jgi:hypothetical protein
MRDLIAMAKPEVKNKKGKGLASGGCKKKAPLRWGLLHFHNYN